MRFWLGFVILFSLVACNRLKSDTYRSRKSFDSVATKETAEKVVIEYTDSGLLKARITTPLMVGVKKIREPYIEMPKGIDVDFYNSKGAVESFLKADYAISYSNKKTIIVRREVEVLNIKGDTLNTEELIWDQNTGQIRTEKFVTIKTKTQTFTGTGMTSDQAFNDWEITNVSGIINKK